jgi:Spy/CpxP family protein refolding chaperone
MKIRFLPGGVAAVLLASAIAHAQPYGPGMMGRGPGAYGTGPGMMGGYGMGPGMMGGWGGPGWGPGMMGGGGMGPGMMGGWGGPGWGPGMMWGGAPYAGLDLTPEQRTKLDGIRQEASRSMWQLMGKMHERAEQTPGVYGPGGYDEQAARSAYQQMAELQKQMFELQLDTGKKIDGVLTKEQREQLGRYGAR